MKEKCLKETAMKLLEALCQNLPTGFRVRREAAANFIVLSELADVLAQEFGAKRVRLDAASETDAGTIFVDTDEVIFEKGCSHPFFEYIKYAEFLNFSETSDGSLRITFGVKDLVVSEQSKGVYL